MIIMCAFVAFAFVIELKMVGIVCDDYSTLARRQDIKTVDVSAGRASITDCDFNKLTDTENQTFALITGETDINKIIENIQPADREKFLKSIENTQNVLVSLDKPTDRRKIYVTTKRYSANNAAQNLIGYTDRDGNGVAGLEKALNTLLKDKGQQFSIEFNVDGNGEIYGDVETVLSHKEDVLSLTIEKGIQRMAEAVAKENIKNGSIVILETQTGKIKAMVSAPCYDATNIENYLSSDNSPMVNKALSAYRPGSVIKPLWAAILLENGFDSRAIYDCKGYTEINGHIYHCANNLPHGQVNMEQALTVSCNCYFIDAFIENKAEGFKNAACLANFGKNLELCQEYRTSAGDFPSWSEINNSGVLAQTCFGQGGFSVTPVHIAAYMNMIANGGVYIRPQIAMGIYDKNTQKQKTNLYSRYSKRIISADTAKKVTEMLKAVNENGARGRAKPNNLTGAGKTGTAQTGKRNNAGEEIYTSWYCGFYPRDNPKYTVCICIYDGGESSVSAAPIFKTICDNLYYMKLFEENTD